MNTEHGSEEPDEGYLNFENLSVTADQIKEGSAWCRATVGTNSSFTQAMDSRGNTLADWSRGNRYQGLKKWTSNRIPSKEKIADYLDSFLAGSRQDSSASPEDAAVPSSPSRNQATDLMTVYRSNEAGQVNDWWASDSRQRFWLEITDRPDIGIDLHCPQRDALDRHTPGYSLIWWVLTGDVVFHYEKDKRAITAWSRAAGQVTEAPTVWLSHRAATRRRLHQERPQQGWWLDLDGPFLLDPPLTLAQIRAKASELHALLATLRSDHPGSLYFPFSFYGGTEPRPQQPYLNKLPAEFVELFPVLAKATVSAAPSAGDHAALGEFPLGTSYRESQVSPVPSERKPFTVDPALVERGLKGHADTQNELALILRQAGIEPRSRLPREPNYDLAWEAGGAAFVAEIKSITNDNEEEQLRLGLGQVLRYRHRLRRIGHGHVVAVLVPERAPRDSSWAELCRDLGVILLPRNELNRAPQLSPTSDP